MCFWFLVQMRKWPLKTIPKYWYGKELIPDLKWVCWRKSYICKYAFFLGGGSGSTVFTIKLSNTVIVYKYIFWLKFIVFYVDTYIYQTQKQFCFKTLLQYHKVYQIKWQKFMHLQHNQTITSKLICNFFQKTFFFFSVLIYFIIVTL